MIRISARCTTNMRRQVDNVNRQSRLLSDGRTYRQSLKFPSVRMKLQISDPFTVKIECPNFVGENVIH